MHTSPTHLTSYPVVKSEKNNVQTIHFVNYVCTSIYQYMLGCPGTYYTLLGTKFRIPVLIELACIHVPCIIHSLLQ
jgi:hypothetical protein